MVFHQPLSHAQRLHQCSPQYPLSQELSRLDQRQLMKHKRNQVSDQKQSSASSCITRKILASMAYKKARHLAFYVAYGKEIDLTDLLYESLRRHKKCYLPVIRPGGRLWFVRYRGQAMTINSFGIEEPAFLKKRVHEVLPSWALNIVFTPLLAFDHQGHRLGMGGGYYDKTFQFFNRQTLRPKLMGVAYEIQRLPHITCQPWDISLDTVVTEENIYSISLK